MTTAEAAAAQCFPAFPIVPARTSLSGTHAWLMENPHPGFAASGTHGYRRLLAGNLLNAQGNPESSCESAEGFTVVGNNPLSYTDPSGMFGEATAAGCTAGPVGCAIGAAIDIGAILGGIS